MQFASAQQHNQTQTELKMPAVADIMTTDVHVIAPSASLECAAQMMDEWDLGSLPVCEGGRLLGIVTDRDIAVRGTSSASCPWRTCHERNPARGDTDGNMQRLRQPIRKRLRCRVQGRIFTFDSFECAIHRLAPQCAHCGCRIIGHGVEAGQAIYCCVHCARHAGVEGVVDHAAP